MTLLNPGWVGVDLDGTLAVYSGWVSPSHIGEPIKPMVERVKRWLADGRTVKVFTARVASESQREEAEDAIRRWTLKHIGVALEATCKKDFAMVELWDDRCVQVVPNTGERIG